MLLFAFGFCHSLQAQTKIEAAGEKQSQGSQDVMSAYDTDLMMRLSQSRFRGDLDEMIGRRIVRVLWSAALLHLPLGALMSLPAGRFMSESPVAIMKAFSG
jgi:hypothetical protein